MKMNEITGNCQRPGVDVSAVDRLLMNARECDPEKAGSTRRETLTCVNLKIENASVECFLKTPPSIE